MHTRTRRGLAILACLVALTAQDASAYEVETHDEISDLAARRSSADATLKESLGFVEGLTDVIGRKPLLKWLAEGSVKEDRVARYANHFHNPTVESWLGAGFGGNFAQSAILWGQNPDQEAPSWSWLNVRQYYLDAMTARRKSDRDQALADTFEGLGRLIHLIQDVASPAHTRNDPHKAYNYESYVRDVEFDPWPGRIFEGDLLVPERIRFRQWLEAPQPRPDPAWQTLAANSLAPIPIARLFDTERYRRLGPTVTTEPLIGLAEYTSANFLSEDRIFTEDATNFQKKLPYPRRTSADIAEYPIRFLDDAGTIQDVIRQYYVKARDGDAGYRLATVGFLRDYLIAYQLDPDRYQRKPALDELVYRDYAARLLPRAVAYSTTMLDYFFRGRLDVDLFADPDDPALVRVRGTNASEELLDAGTLRLYADDPAGARTPLTPASPTADLTVTAAKGKPVVSALFRMTPDAERVVAVYQGKLGEEKPDQAGTFPGAVIGKVLGGVRVEEIFGDGKLWKLRTPKGVYDLVDEAGKPVTVARFEVVKFGDDRDLLVARTPFGTSDDDNLNRVIAYRVPRPANAVPPPSGSVDPVTDELGSVHLERVAEAVLPPAIPLTQVQFRSYDTWEQRVMRVTGAMTWIWDDICECEILDSVTYAPPTFDVLVPQQNVDFALDFEIVLDRAHGLPFPEVKWRDNYMWDLADVTVDRRGHLLALVYAFVTTATITPQRVPSYYIHVTQDGATEKPYGDLDRVTDFPAETPDPLLWALVDLTDRRLIASTAEPVVPITVRYAHPPEEQPTIHWPDGKSGYLVRMTQIRPGGTTPGSWQFAPFIGQTSQPITLRVPLQVNRGYAQFTVEGIYPPALETALRNAGLPTQIALGALPEAYQLVFACTSHAPQPGCAALDYRGADNVVLAWPTELTAARRRTPAADAGQLVFVGDAGVFTWDPAEDATRGRAALRYRAAGDFTYLAGATSSTTLVYSGRILDWETWDIEYSSALVPLDGSQAAREYPGVNLNDSFVLLDPGYLYSATELKFFTTTPTPERTVLPATLAPGPGGNPIGYYHAIRVP